MKSKSISLIYIYTNCFIYIAVIILLFGGVLQRAQYPFWNNKEMNKLGIVYDLTALGVIIITLIIIIGLIRLKPWGRLLAMIWNVGIAFLLIGLKLIGYYVLIGFSGSAPEDFNYFDSDTILQFVFGIILIILTISYKNKSIKELFH
jgi:hypothetical protein